MMNRLNSLRLTTWIFLLILQVLGVVTACGQEANPANGPAAPADKLLGLVTAGLQHRVLLLGHL